MGYILQFIGVAVLLKFDGIYDALGVVLMFVGFGLIIEESFFRVKYYLTIKMENRFNRMYEHIQEEIEKNKSVCVCLNNRRDGYDYDD